LIDRVISTSYINANGLAAAILIRKASGEASFAHHFVYLREQSSLAGARCLIGAL
jgi:hypothetical protein